MTPFLWYLTQAAVSLLIFLVLMLISNKHFPSLRRYKLIQKLPGPKGMFLLGNTIELRKVPIENLLEWLETKLNNYDRLMRIWLIVVSNVYLKDPDDLQVLLNSTQNINKGHEYFMLEPWLGEGLLTSSGLKWHSRRKLLTPAFHFKILEENMTIFNRNAKILCQKLEESKGEEISLESYITLCTLDVIMGTAMGINLDVQKQGGKEYVSQLKNISKLFTERMMRPHLFITWMFNISDTGRKFKKVITYLHNFSYNVIKERKREFSINTNNIQPTSFKTHRAFLDRMLECELLNPGSFTDKDLREEVDTFMFEGHDTTSAALVFIFFNIARYPYIQERIYTELCQVFEYSDRDATTNDLNGLIYLEKVIKESLRLYPSVAAITRLLHNDLILNDGTIIPSFTNVIVPIYLIHKNKKYWSDPEKFDPERFSEEEMKGRHPYSYIPFSAGPRNCIGQKFAIMELKTIVSTVLRTLKIEAVTKPEDFKLLLFLVLRTDKPVRCKFVPREK